MAEIKAKEMVIWGVGRVRWHGSPEGGISRANTLGRYNMLF